MQALPPVLGRAWVCSPGAAQSAAQQLRVATYNVLAQCYTRSSWFPWSPSASLKWKQRGAALLRDIDALSADVLLLQECEDCEPFWVPALRQRGYEGLWKKRTEVTGAKKDGCAIFWRAAALALDGDALFVEHNELCAGLPPRPEGSPPPRADNGATLDARTRLERDCVGVVAQLAILRDGPRGADAGALGADVPRLVVANTHLYWDPAFADVKLAQAEHMLRRIALFRADCAARRGAAAEPPVVFGGDFNSLPASEVHALLTRHDGAPPLRSAYAAAAGAEPSYTNLTPDFTGTLDYLLVSPDVAVVAALETPGPGLGVGLPDASHPSDHLPLAALLGFGDAAAPS